MNPPAATGIGGIIRVAQIIAGSLMGGVLMFAAVVLVIAVDRQPAAQPIVTYVAIGVAALMIVLRYFIPTAMASAQRRQFADATRNEAEELTTLGQVFQTKTIVAFALLEGAAFLCLIAYMLEKHSWNLAMAGVLLLLMAAGFPTPSKFEHWAEGQRQLLSLDRRE